MLYQNRGLLPGYGGEALRTFARKGPGVSGSGRRTIRTWAGRGWSKRGVVCLFALLLAASFPGAGQAQDLNFFRIGTGSSAGTYFPIGGIIASSISNPPGSRECQRGGSCGVPGLIAVAQSTHGSVANVEGIASGTIESGFSQADIAYWAYHGIGIYADKGQVAQLRAIANLYPESIHLVVRRGAGIRSVADLAGKRVSLDREGSGTRVDALLILAAYGLGPEDLQAESLGMGAAADKLRAGELDGFFIVVGTPANVVKALADDYGGSDFQWTTNPEQRNKLWQARHDAAYAAKALRTGCEVWATDVCVPISRLAECILETKQDLEDSFLVAPIVGHVGDGNFHIAFVLDMNDENEVKEAERINERLVARALSMDGTCTGEHGVGLGKIKYMTEEHGPAISVMRALKTAMDPQNIMNPGKMLPAN